MLLSGVVGLALAVEGMWEPSQLEARRAALEQAGFSGDAAALSRLDAAPLGAVVSIGGCTASFVSTDGLLVTNHHCVVGWLQQAQRDGENLLDTGFWAPTRDQERSVGPGGRVYLTTKSEDVTAAVTGKIPKKIKDADRATLLEKRTKDLVATCESPGGLRCRVASFYEGASYQLVTQVELRDVRLVYAPPDSVGNYGDEVDNWHWPRHAGEFAFVRAYVGADGRPADHAASNVAYKPRYVLKLAERGPRPGEFAMVAGYPGATQRWRTALEVARAATSDLPREIAELEYRLSVFADVVEADPAAAAVMEPGRLSVSNHLDNAKGTLDGYRHSGVVATAEAREQGLRDWIAADPARTEKFAAALEELRKVVTRRDATRERDLVSAYMSSASDLLGAAELIYEFARQREKPDAARELGYQDRDLPRARARLAQLQAHLQLDADRRLLRHYLLAALALPADQHVPGLREWVHSEAGVEPAVDAALARLYTSPPLADPKYRVELLDGTLAQIEASSDPFLQLAVALRPLRDLQRAVRKDDEGASSRLRPLYVQAIRGFDPGRTYADANNTLRVTFGTVKDYVPRDGVFYTPRTTLAGVAAKAGAWPFDAPRELLAAISSGEDGPYRDDTLGDVPVNFLADLDITGGNSGSPTLNDRGELVGLAFDGNYESIASDWLFDAPVTRSIHVDVRYMLYYLDVVAGADSLVEELGMKRTRG